MGTALLALGLHPSDPWEKVEQTFRRLARLHHPDQGKRFICFEINGARMGNYEFAVGHVVRLGLLAGVFILPVERTFG